MFELIEIARKFLRGVMVWEDAVERAKSIGFSVADLEKMIRELNQTERQTY